MFSADIEVGSIFLCVVFVASAGVESTFEPDASLTIVMCFQLDP
jgi:hypothetical protein